MAKRRKGSAESPERVLDFLGTVGSSHYTRLVALAIFYSINGTDPSLEMLVFRTGLSEYQINSAIDQLRKVGVFTEVEGRMRLSVPNFCLPDGVARKLVTSQVSESDRTDELMAEFKLLWIKRYKRQCSLNGRDRARVFDLIQQIGFEEAKERLGVYLRSDDGWLTERCHPLAVFCKTSNAYCRGSNGKAKIVGRSSEFDEEVRRFEREREREDSE